MEEEPTYKRIRKNTKQPASNEAGSFFLRKNAKVKKAFSDGSRANYLHFVVCVEDVVTVFEFWQF